MLHEYRIDTAKEINWVTVTDANGIMQIGHKLPNMPIEIAALSEQLVALDCTACIGIAGLAEAMLAEAGFDLVHLAVLH